MPTVIITTRGIPPQQFVSKLIGKIMDIERGVDILGNEVTSRMRQIIEVSKRRESDTHNDKWHKFTSNNLSQSIEKKIAINTPTRFGVGIGDKNDLYKNAIYWRVVNDGGYIPPAVRGFFSDGGGPRTGMSGQSFRPDVNGPLMVPKSPIRPMKYIETTHIWLKSYWVGFWQSFLRAKKS